MCDEQRAIDSSADDVSSRARNATVLTAPVCELERRSRPPGTSYTSTELSRAIAARSPSAEIAGIAEVNPLPTGVTLGNRASSRPFDVSQTCVGRSLQPIARNRRSGWRLVKSPQKSLIGGELQRRKLAVASQTCALPSHEALMIRRDRGSKCATPVISLGPSRVVSGTLTVGSVTTTAPVAAAATIMVEAGSNSRYRI